MKALYDTQTNEIRKTYDVGLVFKLQF